MRCGFDMIWIVGGQQIIQSILQFFKPAVRDSLMVPLSEHAEWNGFMFYDLIFPLFIFLVGVSVVFSLGGIRARREGRGLSAACPAIGDTLRVGGLLLRRLREPLARRAPVGRIAANRFVLPGGWDHFHQLSCAGNRSCTGYPAGWLLGAAGVCAGARSGQNLLCAGENWANYIDAKILIGQKYAQTWDPEGLLSTLPAIATCLIGVLVGLWVKNQNVSNWAKAGSLIGGGLIGLLLGYGWGGELATLIGNLFGHRVAVEPGWGWYPFPVIKDIWTSSYVLVAAGYSCILLGIFYAIIDIWKFERWAMPFIWIGTNAITLYMAWNIVDFEKLAHRLVGGGVRTAVEWLMSLVGQPTLGEPAVRLVAAAVALGLMLLLARFLYRRKIFLRV